MRTLVTSGNVPKAVYRFSRKQTFKRLRKQLVAAVRLAS